jgi:hypothetical protein
MANPKETAITETTALKNRERKSYMPANTNISVKKNGKK